MMVGARTAAWSGKALPYYCEVEYLESTGTQYIDTGVKANKTQVVDIVAICLQPGFLFGSRLRINNDQSSVIFEDTSDGLLGVTYGNKYIARSIKFTTNTEYKIHIENKNTIINNVNYNNEYGSSYFSGNMFLFTINNGGSAHLGSYAVNRIKSFSVKEEGTLVRDFIPVRVGDVGYMYDRVSGQLFRNAGTGAFIIGPDKTT